MTEAATSLLCPKCGAEMRSYERNGVTVDQCTGCRGIFLDRGELERLVEAEGSYYAGGGGTPAGPPAPARRDDREHGGGYDKHGSYDKHGKRRRGFLGELFD